MEKFNCDQAVEDYKKELIEKIEKNFIGFAKWNRVLSEEAIRAVNEAKLQWDDQIINLIRN